MRFASRTCGRAPAECRCWRPRWPARARRCGRQPRFCAFAGIGTERFFEIAGRFRDTRIWTRRADGVWAGDRYLGEAAAVQLLGGGNVVVASADQVRLLRSDGTETDFAVACVRSLIRIGDAYVQLVTSNGMWALAIEPRQERVFLLPGGSQ